MNAYVRHVLSKRGMRFNAALLKIVNRFSQKSLVLFDRAG
jgi:hypothetical protein